MSELEKLRAENDRLREALNRIVNFDRARGYPTGKEWGEILTQVEDALSKG